MEDTALIKGTKHMKVLLQLQGTVLYQFLLRI